jgi:hypothetical protein
VLEIAGSWRIVGNSEVAPVLISEEQAQILRSAQDDNAFCAVDQTQPV